MPTALPLTFSGANAALVRGVSRGIPNTYDLAVPCAFTAIGVLLTFSLIALSPQAGNAVALALAMT